MNDDQIENIIIATESIADSIKPHRMFDGKDHHGIEVGCLVEAQLSVSKSIQNVADALNRIADNMD